MLGLSTPRVDIRQAVSVLHGHEGPVHCLDLHGQGRLMLSGGADGIARLWDFQRAERLGEFDRVPYSLGLAKLTLDGRRAFVGDGQRHLRLHDAETGKTMQELRGELAAARSLALSPDGKTAVLGGQDGRIRILDIQTLDVIHVLERHPLWEDMSPGGLMMGNNYEFAFHDYLGDLQYGKTTCSEPFSFHGHAGPITTLAVTPDGHFLLSGSEDGTLRQWDLRRNQCCWILGGNRKVSAVVPQSVECLPDSRQIVEVRETLRVWRLSRLDGWRWLWSVWKEYPRKIFLPAADLTPPMAWARQSGGVLACRGMEASLVFCRINGQRIRVYAGHEQRIQTLALHPDGRRVVSGSQDGSIRIWEI